jgi:hypothetical protein
MKHVLHIWETIVIKQFTFKNNLHSIYYIISYVQYFYIFTVILPLNKAQLYCLKTIYTVEDKSTLKHKF